MLVCQTLQNFVIGGVTTLRFASVRERQFFEQNARKLHWAVDVESFPCKFVNLLGKFVQLQVEILGHLFKQVHVHFDTFHFHAVKQVGKGQLDIAVQMLHTIFRKFFGKFVGNGIDACANLFVAIGAAQTFHILVGSVFYKVLHQANVVGDVGNG